MCAQVERECVDIVQIFDAVTCHLTPPGRLEAHCNIIYDLSWSADSHVLVSCSSDCTAKVWYLDAATSHTQRNSCPFATPRLASLPYCTVLHHPTYAYCCKMHPNASLTQMAATRQNASERGTSTGSEAAILLVTGCADGMLYFWSLNADMDPLLPPDGAEPLLRKRAGLTLHADSSAACLNALLWDVGAPAQLHGGMQQLKSTYTLEPEHETTLHASQSFSAQRQSLGGQACSTVGGARGEYSTRDADFTGGARSSRSGHRGGSAKGTLQHSNVLFSGALHCHQPPIICISG